MMVVGKYDIQQPTYATCYANGLESTLTETFKNGDKCSSKAKIYNIHSFLNSETPGNILIKAIAASYPFT